MAPSHICITGGVIAFAVHSLTLESSSSVSSDGTTFTNSSEPKVAVEATQAAYTIGGTSDLGQSHIACRAPTVVPVSTTVMDSAIGLAVLYSRFVLILNCPLCSDCVGYAVVGQWQIFGDNTTYNGSVLNRDWHRLERYS
jgi:hypothetical protein